MIQEHEQSHQLKFVTNPCLYNFFICHERFFSWMFELVQTFANLVTQCKHCLACIGYNIIVKLIMSLNRFFHAVVAVYYSADVHCLLLTELCTVYDQLIYNTTHFVTNTTALDCVNLLYSSYIRLVSVCIFQLSSSSAILYYVTINNIKGCNYRVPLHVALCQQVMDNVCLAGHRLSFQGYFSGCSHGMSNASFNQTCTTLIIVTS